MRIYESNYVLYAYPDGTTEIAKNRKSGETGQDTPIEILVDAVSDIIAHNKFKKTNNSLFQEALADEIKKSINEVLKGKHNDRSVQRSCRRNGP